MAQVTSGGSDEVAVDIEVFEDCDTQLGSSSSEDEVEEIAFRREDLNPNWISSIKGKILFEPGIIKSSSARKSCSIHRVPSWLRRENSDAYDPKVISIGPLHYEKRKGELRAMEEHKWKYLHDIVSRKQEDGDEGWLEDCLAAVKRLEKSARNCYSEVIPLHTDSFVEMMVLDGCFILELFRKVWNDDDNVILKLDWLIQAISFDLLLMENQIPFFILQRLSDLIDSPGPSPPLVQKALKFLVSNDSNVLTLLTKINDPKIRIRHLLHLLHTIYVICPGKYTELTEIPQIDCASKLEERGIKFRKRPDVQDYDFLDIKFDKGVIEIPPIQIWDKTERENLNLIAFEQCYIHCPCYITGYHHFMDCLINTAKDVDILCREGIIDNRLGNEKLVASHFNSMVREANKCAEDFYLSGVCEKINVYSKRRWPRLRASLVHDYFNNPWAIISFLAAVLLLLLTMTQTFFTSFPKFAAGK
eukprot:TRINITY_DN42903_c0_g1_i1.p1 TRINITY_DN42903_c0_g1~~TRINITY_DN42903_c0_g1_i1.p1  ORF type:complete len:474 (+),score=58.18 TRINITY_DN42903_c0_g1_i1:49-1470(+)